MDIKIKVAVIIEGSDNRVLLIKEKLAKKQTALWNVIKGTHDSGETIFEAAIRECGEEVSLAVTLDNALGVYISEEQGKRRVQFNFLAHTNSLPPKLASTEEQASRDEHIEEMRWFTKNEIKTMCVDEFVSVRTFELLHDWIDGRVFPLEVYKHVVM